MAKKNRVQIDVEINGKMQKATVDAKKLRGQLDGLSGSAHSTDRRLKGASQQSANTTKNFSKMAQGITGGLVPAYAILASSVFAMSAAFNFLKNAGDLRTLQQGQVAYASATGVGLRTLTKSVQDAAGGMLTFRDAAQAASIGVAAGLSPDQLTRLGKAAKDVSIVLGRDVTDSFNRLVRGATKAEPELLDELGIILRLDDATKLYADKLGIAAGTLTTFQRQQAVTNFVLGEAERKYGAILDIVEVQPNAFAQLGKAFDDIMNKVKSLIETALSPLAETLTRFPALAVAAFGLLGASIMKSIIPGLQDFGANAKSNFEIFSSQAEIARQRAVAFNATLAKAKLDPGATSAMGDAARAGASSTLQQAGPKSAFSGKYAQVHAGDFSNISKKQVSNMIEDLEKGTGQAKLLSQSMRDSMILDLKDVQLEMKVTGNVVEVETAEATTKAKFSFKSFELSAKAAIAGIKAQMSTLAIAASRLMSAFGWISILATAGTMLYSFIKPVKELTAEEKKLAETTENLEKKLQSLGNEFTFLTDVMQHHNKEAFTLAETFTVLGNALSNLSEDEMGLNVKNFESALPVLQQISKEIDRLNTNRAAYNAKDVSQGRKPRFEMIDSSMEGIVKRAQSGVNDLSDEEAAAVGFFTTIQNAMNATENEALKNATSFKNLAAALQGVGEVSLEEAIKQFQASSKALDSITKTGVENAKKSRQLFASFMPESKFDQQVALLEAEKKAIDELTAKEGTLSAIEEERLKVIEKQVIAFKRIAVEKHKDLMMTMKINNMALASQRGATPLQKERLNTQKELLHVNRKIVAIQNNNRIVQSKINEEVKKATANGLSASEANVTAGERQLEINREKTLELALQKQALEDQLNLQFQLNEAFKAGFEAQTTKGVEGLITGEESSFGDVALESVQAGLKGMASTLAKDMSRNVSDFMFGKKALKDPENADDVLKTVYDSATGALKVVMAGAPKVDPKPTPSTPGKVDPKNFDTGGGTPGAGQSIFNADGSINQTRGYSMGTGNMMSADGAIDWASLGVTKESMAKPTITGQGAGVVGGMANVTKEQLAGSGLSLTEYMNQMNATGTRPGEGGDGEGLPGGEGFLEGLKNVFTGEGSEDGFVGRLGTFFQGQAEGEGFIGKMSTFFTEAANHKDGFVGKLKDTFKEKLLGPDGFLQGLGSTFKEKGKNLLDGLGGFLGKMKDGLGGFLSEMGGALKGLFSGGGGGGGLGGLLSTVAGAFGFGGGGVGARYGGIMKEYATGGIARGRNAGYPAMLHGTEAVVPLPNGNKIPVEMQGGGGNNITNNITVNVSKEGASQETTSSMGESSKDDAKLANALSLAVQEELVKQQRPGGLLSQYGAG